MKTNDQPPQRKRKLTATDYVQGVLQNNRAVLAQAITLVESHADRHFQLAQEVLSKLIPHTGKSVRIGITGVPGAGKSTLIEAFGSYLCKLGHNVAVLAVDPSSQRSKGSILGDKTRMDQLSRNTRAFIRPSPAGESLGGVARKSRETMLLCEAAGYDVIIVETVGVGQSETTVRSMVDLFIVLMLTGAGDELQGMKKGVLEMADLLLINKADGDNKERALAAMNEYNHILHYLPLATKGWSTKAYTCSALHGEGIIELWQTVNRYLCHTKEQQIFQKRRKDQQLFWLHEALQAQILANFYSNHKIQENLPELERQIEKGELNVSLAVQLLLDSYEA